MKRLPLTQRSKVPGYRLITHASPDMVAALDKWISRQPEPRPTRAQALGYALQDWLTGQGLLKHRDDPEGANGRWLLSALAPASKIREAARGQKV